MSDQVLHVLDLPQLYTRPSGASLLQTLDLLALRPRDFTVSATSHDAPPQVNPTGITQYLTSIISSGLSWLESDEAREAVWDAASARLCERSGRTGMADIIRKFNVPVMTRDVDEEGEDGAGMVELTLREPTLTADNLGNKTWVSSFLLSQRLKTLLVPPSTKPNPVLDSESRPSPDQSRRRALELGAGTGLVGLAFAALWGEAASIHLTDLGTIVPNIEHNIDLNNALLSSVGATAVTAGVLDWSIVHPTPVHESGKYDTVLVADPLYSPDHPRWLVQTIERWLRRDGGAKVVVEMPLRTPYLPQIEDFKSRMASVGLGVLEEGEEVGYDDWYGQDGQPLEVKCWWSVWCWKEDVRAEVAVS